MYFISFIAKSWSFFLVHGVYSLRCDSKLVFFCHYLSIVYTICTSTVGLYASRATVAVLSNNLGPSALTNLI